MVQDRMTGTTERVFDLRGVDGACEFFVGDGIRLRAVRLSSIRSVTIAGEPFLRLDGDRFVAVKHITHFRMELK